MNLKKFSIISSIIIGILIVTLVTLSLIRVDNGMTLDEPSKIIFYPKTTAGVHYTKEETPSKFNQAKKLYEEMTNLSVLDYMLAGKSLKQDPSQDVNQLYKTWTESNKTNSLCMELIFEEKQSVVINVDGNTKVVEFYGLIMMLEKTALGHEVAMYFSTSTGTSKSYSTSPILIHAKQTKLYILANSLIND